MIEVRGEEMYIEVATAYFVLHDYRKKWIKISGTGFLSLYAYVY